MNPSPCPLPRTHPSAPSLRAGKGGINSPSPAHDPPCPEGGWRSEERAKPGGFEPGEFNRRIVPGWAKPANLPIKNGHGLVFDKSGYLYLLTDHADANLLIFDPATGRVVHQKNLGLTGGHGLSIVEENLRQVLFMTCLNTHRVLKTTLQGEVLAEWGWPKETGKYKSADEYKPSWTLHLASGDFYVLDGYGKDYRIFNIAQSHAQVEFLYLTGCLLASMLKTPSILWLCPCVPNSFSAFSIFLLSKTISQFPV